MKIKAKLFTKNEDGNYYESPHRHFKYDSSVLENSLREFMLKGDNKLGVLADPGSMTDPHVKLMDASHKIEDVVFKDDRIDVDVDVLNTPRGNVLKEIISNGMVPVFTINFYGNLDDETNTITEIYDLMSINVTDFEHENTSDE